MTSPIRRIVTGHDQSGKAVVLFDSVDPHKRVRPQTGIVSRTLWLCDRSPASISQATDPVPNEGGIAPPDGGSVMHIVDFPPWRPDAAVAQNYMQRNVGGAQSDAAKAHPHPMVHRTRTLDYAIVLSGEIDMLLDDSSVRCRAGDVVIQQGTNHGWVNNGNEPCRIAFVMLDAEERPPAGGLTHPEIGM